jgi:hypothetical protein
MKAVKILGLVVAAALLTAAFAGASSAAAASTTLCSISENPCAEANRHPAGAFEAKNTTTVSLDTSVANIKCTGSTMSGETLAASGDPLPMKFNGWLLGACATAGGTKCTTTEVGQPSSGAIAWTGGNKGALKVSSGGSGDPGWNLKCGFLISCDFTSDMVLDYSSSSVQAVAEPLKTSGSFCPAAATFSGTYQVTKPAPSYVAQTEAGTPGTTFCNEGYVTCFGSDRYPSGTALSASSNDVQIKSVTWPTLSCTSNLSGEIGATGSGGLPVTIGNLTLSGCKTQAGTACTTEVYGAPYPGTASWTSGGDGELAVEDTVSVKMVCGFQLNCTITFAQPHVAITGGNPARLTIGGIEGQTSGSPCLSLPHLSATYDVTSPKPLFVAHT